MESSRVIVSKDPAELASRAARVIVEAAREAVAQRGRFTLALAGGSTPEKTYALLAEPDLASQIDWDRTYLFFGDERFVPAGDPQSNFGMAQRALLASVPVPADHVFPVRTDVRTPEQAAVDYERTLQDAFGTAAGSRPPRFDLVLLGLGDDGHTASLFPNAAALAVEDRWVVSTPPGTLPPPVDRVTLTYPVLNAARQVLFLVSGEKKAAALQDVLEDHPSREQRPAAGVRPSDGTLLWLVDEAAAGSADRGLRIADLGERAIRNPNARLRLLIADVDGTLVTREKVLTPRARQAVQRLKETGIAFAITSGRPPAGMRMLIGPLGLETPAAAFNGGMFVRPDFSIIDQRALPADCAPEIVRAIEAHGLDVWVYRGSDWLVRQRHGPHVDHEEWTVKFPPTAVPSYEGLLTDVVKIVGVSDDLDAVARCEAEIRQQWGYCVSAARSQPYYLDVTHPEANKGAVVRRLSELLGIPPEEIATIGDMPNDILMFQKSGISIAMGQASAEVQQAAHYVTTSSEEEGFASAVERYVLS